MTPHEIKTEIYRRRPHGLNISVIARRAGRTRQHVLMVIEGKSVSRYVAELVSAAIELPLEVVFPRYAGASLVDESESALSACQ